MADPNSLLEAADWRLDTVAEVASAVGPAFPGGPAVNKGDIVMLSTVTRTSKGEIIGFITPSTSALALNVSRTAAKEAISLREKFKVTWSQSPFGPGKHIAPNDIVFDFFERCMVSATFAFQALEAFANYSISRSWRQDVEVKKKRKREVISHLEAERALSTDEKLKTVLPKIYGVRTPSGLAVWDGFIRLKRVRDSIVHIKYHDQYPSMSQEIDRESLFFNFLDMDPRQHAIDATRMMLHFFQGKEAPRWLKLFCEEKSA
jgi:hypothetical protein